MSHKVLCLHGFLQNGKIFSEKSSGIRKLLKKLDIQLDYIDGPINLERKDLPFEITDDNKWNEIVEAKLNKSWFYHDDVSKNLDLTQGIKTVVEHIKEHGPYDGIIGFSQGAALTAIIANTITKYPEAKQPFFKFALTFSGYTFTEPSATDPNTLVITDKFVDSFKVPVEDPAYHTVNIVVYGANDNAVPGERSEYLSSLYPKGEQLHVFKHEGGHMVPNKKDFLKPIVDVIERSLQ